MKKFLLPVLCVLLLSCVACSTQENRENFTDLHEAFRARGEGVEGYGVTEIESYDGLEYFFVRVCLNTDDADSIEDIVWFEAEVMLFSSTKEADSAYDQNQQSGLGGTCLRQGNILIYWMENDPFADLYEEVIHGVFG